MKQYALLLALTLGVRCLIGNVLAQEPAEKEEKGGNARGGVPWLVAQPQALNVAIGPVWVAKGPPVWSVLTIGSVQVEGAVQGDVVSLGGVITLAAGASVGGTAVALGGHVERAEGANVEVATQLDPTAKMQGIDTSEEENGLLLGLGDVTVPADRTVALALAFGGTLTVRGTVTQVAAGVGGDVVLEAGSVAQDVCAIGGVVRPAPGAKVQGEVQQSPGYLSWLPRTEGETALDSRTTSMVSKSVLPHPSLRYSQNLQWSASQGIRTATVETGFNWIWRDLQLSGRSQTAAQGAKPASQVDLKLNYHFQDTSVSWSYFRTAGPRPEPAAGPPAPGAEQGAPANPDRLRGDQLRAQGQYVEAIEVYQQALTRGAEEGKAYLGMGQCYWHLGDFQSAIDQYEEVLLHDPNESEAYLGLGASYRALGDHEKAISYLQELLKRAPGSVWGRVELGLAQRSLGEPEAALQTLREAIRTAPRMWQPRYYLAETCFQSGDPEACQGVLREALELPLDKEAVNQILTLLARAGGLPAQ